MSISARHGNRMWYRRKVRKMNTKYGVGIHSNHSCLILRICVWVYRFMDTMFPPLLIFIISDFSIVGKSILDSEELFLLPWVLEPLYSLISVPSLSWLVCFPPFYIFLQLLCSLFVIVLFLLSLSHSLPTLLSALIETLTLNCCYCLLECNDDIPVRHIWCTFYSYAYNRFF